MTYLAALGLLGCSSDPATKTELPKGKQNLSMIAEVYSQATFKLGRAPKSAEDLKPFLKEHGDPEELLRSPNDGLPYAVVPGADINSSPENTPIVAYEQKGKDGKRHVVDARQMVREVTDAEFTTLKFPPGYRPSGK